MPAAEFDVEPDLVRRLLQVQHPDLAELPLTVVGNGWDNTIVRAGDDLAVRLPRRHLAAALIAHEQRWLPLLGPRLSLPVPVPLRTGLPGLGYPWPWSVAPFLPGEIAASTPPADFSQAAADLGTFLASLHTIAPPDAPVNPYRGIPLAQRQVTLAQNLAACGPQVATEAVNRLWQRAVGTPEWRRPAVWLHGDLHPANIIVAAGRISAVIDFGDLTSGDPATDLAVAWMLLPATAHERFWAAYASAAEHEADDDLRTRSKGWALAMSLTYLANSCDHPPTARIGRRTLEAVLDTEFTL